MGNLAFETHRLGYVSKPGLWFNSTSTSSRHSWGSWGSS